MIVGMILLDEMPERCDDCIGCEPTCTYCGAEHRRLPDGFTFEQKPEWCRHLVEGGEEYLERTRIVRIIRGMDDEC